MSLDHTIHLEPFIKIPVQYEPYSVEVKTCGEHTHKPNDRFLFCTKCGKKVETKTVYNQSIVSADELLQNENLCDYIEGETMYLYSNTKSDTEIDTDENVYTTITPELISVMIAEFTQKHKAEIELLQTKLNTQIKVEFGFVYEVR